MKIATPILALALPCSVLAQQAEPVKISPPLQQTVKQLDTDGIHFSITNIKGDLNEFSTLIDKIFLGVLKKESPELSKLSATKILEISGLTQAQTIGRSSKHVGDFYHNRTFIETKGSDRGLLSLIGNTPQPWASASYAPAGADLVVESNINLKLVPQTLREIATMLPGEQASQLEAFLDGPLPATQSRIGETLEKLDLRYSLIVDLDESKTWKGPDGEDYPAAYYCTRIDGAAKTLWPLYKDMLGSVIKYSSKGNVHTIVIPEKMDTPWGPSQPVCVIDTDKNQIWMAFDQGFLDKCLSSEAKLADSESYQKATNRLPQQGFAHAYISGAACKQLLTLSKFGSLLAEGDEDMAFLKGMLDPEVLNKTLTSPFGYAWAARHDRNGLLLAGNSPVPDKGSNKVMNSTFMIAGLSAMSYGPIMRNIKASKRTQSIQEVKNLCMACYSYAEDHDGNFPKSLQDLTKDGYVDNLQDLITIDFPEKGMKVKYLPGFTMTSKASNILMFSEADEDGQVIVCRLDGSVKIEAEEELVQALKAQKR
ncbi:hypothetical protein Rhal01_00017 [Rubritalea halochordaticola]|uniref:DUF1559 domain-containing protein n=1 Tax=Rubritalea halochordaticola TaxID=714537 RepID=A0ABP9UVX1_9BACT